MPITFYCHCGQKLQVPDEMAGKAGKCPTCAAPLTVPPGATDPDPPGASSPGSPLHVASAATAGEADAGETRPCPVCGGAILARAKKCKHCGEYLDPTLRESRALQAAQADRAIPAASNTDGMAIASLVLGILSLPMCVCSVFGAFFGLVALVLGVVGRGNVRRTGRGGGGMALAGIVLGSIGLFLGVAVFAFQIYAQLHPEQFQTGSEPPLQEREFDRGR